MIVYDKTEVKNNLTIDQIYNILQDFGGNPHKSAFGLIALTICHHTAGEKCSPKLYYYENSKLFKCYTGGCEESTFDIFQLVIKLMHNNYGSDINLNDAVLWVVQRFGMSGREVSDIPKEKDSSDLIYERYEELNKIQVLPESFIKLKKYDARVLNNFNYNVVIEPWIKDNISREAMQHNRIGFYPGQWQITIPHFDIDNRLIGIRIRTLVKEDAEKYGKYRPLRLGDKLYNHPLGMNLYNLNNSKKNIALFQKAILFESEKSCLRYQTDFGFDNDISVACCGSSVSAYQIFLLKQCGAKEIVIAFDRDFEVIGDDKYKNLEKSFSNIAEKYKKDILISFIWDRNMITSLKSSPIDESKDKFITLFKDRVIL